MYTGECNIPFSLYLYMWVEQFIEGKGLQVDFWSYVHLSRDMMCGQHIKSPKAAVDWNYQYKSVAIKFRRC